MVRKFILPVFLTGLTLTGPALLFPTSTQAGTVAEIRPFLGAETGLGTFSFQQKIDQKIVFPVVNLTGGLAYRRFNLAANISGSLEDANVSEEDFTGDASRRDFDITAGYQVNRVLSVFIGYKKGRTDLQLLSRNPVTPAAGNEFYQQSGPFAGANVGWNFTNAGKLDLSLAYANLDSDNRFFSDGDGVEQGEILEFDDINGRADGSTEGYSINLGWTMPVSGSLLFRSKLKFNSYEQDIEIQDVKFTGIKEESTMLLVGVVAVF